MSDTKTDPPADEPLTFEPSGEFLDARRFVGLLRGLAVDAPRATHIAELARTLAAELVAEHPKVTELIGDPAPLVESALKLLATVMGETCRQVAQLAELSRVTAKQREAPNMVRNLVIECIPTVVPDDPAESVTG